MLFRSTRGKVAPYWQEVGNIYSLADDDDEEEEPSPKGLQTAFVLVYEFNESLHAKVRRICEAFTSITFEIDSAFSKQERDKKLK